jgi:hypothetical protein
MFIHYWELWYQKTLLYMKTAKHDPVMHMCLMISLLHTPLTADASIPILCKSSPHSPESSGEWIVTVKRFRPNGTREVAMRLAAFETIPPSVPGG